MKLNPLSALLDTLQAASDNGSEQAKADGGAVASGADGTDGSDPSGGVLNVDLPSGQPATLSVDADADPDAIRDAVEASGGSVRGVQGQTDDGTVIPVSTEGGDLDLSDTFFDDEDFEFDFINDSRIQDVRDRQVEYNQRVGRYIMHKDDLVPSIKERIKGLLLGEDGLSVEPADPDNDADQQLADHMEDIYNGRSDVGPSVNPADVVGDMLDQNFQNARWVGRATDLRYLDLESLELVVDGQTGERLYVQDATDYTTFSIDEDNEKDAVDFDLERSDPHALKVGDEVLDAQLYDRPPLEAVVDDVIGKMEMKFLKARKAQIGSVGGLFIKVGTPDYLPEDEYFDRVPNPFTDGDDDTITKLERELQQGIDNAFSTLEDYRSGTVMAIPNNWEVQQVELPDTGESLDEQIRGYNKSIARRLLYPLDLVELQSGAELSRQTLFRTVLNTLQGWRKEIRSVFDSFAEVQKDVHDLNGDVTHSFPTLQNEDEELLVSALKYAGPAGMSESEIRQTLNTLEGFDLDTDQDTGDMPPAGGPADPQQRQDSMDDMLPDQSPDGSDGSDNEPDQQPPDGSDGGSDGDMQGLQAYTPPEGLDLNDLDGWTQASVWDAFLSVGGTFSTCVTEMTGELRNPQGFCAALKDEALGTDLWRKGSGADGAALSGGAAASVWAADPQTVETTATLSEVADALSEASDDGLTELQREDDYVAFSSGGSDPQGDDFSPVVVVDSGEDQYDLSGVSRDVADSVRDMLSGGVEGAGGPLSHVPGIPDSPDTLTRSMLQQYVKHVAEQVAKESPGLTVEVGDQHNDGQAAQAAGFSRTYNAALHPRNPDTGKFVERPYDFNLDQQTLDQTPTTELLQFLKEEGEPVDSLVSGSNMSIDGIPDDADSLDEAKEQMDGQQGSDGPPAQSVVQNPAEILSVDNAAVDQMTGSKDWSDTADSPIKGLVKGIQNEYLRQHGHSDDTIDGHGGVTDTGTSVATVFSAVSNGYRTEQATPLWQAAEDVAEDPGEIPELEDSSDYDPTDQNEQAVIEAFKDVQDFSEAYAREHLTNEDGKVEVFRGLGGDIAEDFRRAKQDNEQRTYSPLAVESYTLDKSAADKYARSPRYDNVEEADTGVIIKQEIDPSEVMFLGSPNMGMNAADREIGVIGDGDRDVDRDNIDVVQSPDDAETALARLSGQSDGSDGSGPFSMIPGVPDNPDRITRDMLNQVAKWKLQQMKQAQGALPDAAIRDPPDVEAFTRTYNPALHPRDPDTGQFVERPFSVVDDLSELSEDSIDNADTSEVVGFLHDSPGEPDMNDVLQDDGITIDGIPDDVSTVEELRNRSETPQTDEDVPTNPRTFEQVGLGSILKAPDGDPVEVVGRDVYSDDRIMTVERPDGTRETIDMDAMRRNTIDEYNADNFSDLPSQQSGEIEDLSVEDISPADPRFVTDLDKPQVEEGDFLRVDPRTFADEPTGEKFVAEVTEKRFRGAEFTVRKPDGSEIDIGAGTEYKPDAHLQPAPEVTTEVDLSELDPSDPSEGFVRELRGSDKVDNVREGDVVTFRETRDADPQFGEVVDDGGGVDYTLLTPDGERVEKRQGDSVKLDGKYTPPVEPAVDPDTFVGEDAIGTTDLSDMPDNLTPSERRERAGGEYLSDDVINEEMVQTEEIPEGSFIAQEVGEDEFGHTGTHVKQVVGYEEKNYTDEKYLKVRGSSGRTSEVKASGVENGGFRPYDPADEPTTTIPEEDWSEDPEERQQAVKSLLDDVTIGGDDGPDRNDDGDISDELFEQAKEQVAEHLSRANDKEHAETVAARMTSIGDDIARAHAVKQFTAWGTPTAYYSVSSRAEERVNHHELGHVIGDAYGVSGGSNDMDGQTFPMPDFAWQGDDVPNKYGLKPPQDSDQYEDGVTAYKQDAYNLDQWQDEVDAQVGNGMDGRNFTGIDSFEESTEAEMLYLSSSPGLNEPRTFSIVEHDPDDFTDDSSRSGHKVRLEDRQGNQHNAVIRDRFGEVNVQWEDASEYSKGTSDEVQGTRKTMPDQWREDPPDPDEHLSDDLPDGSTEDRFRNLADKVNKSWYRQAAAAREQSLDRAARYSIKDGYSTKQAHETLSRIHEVMRSDGIDTSTRAEAARTLVKYHPDLLQAYRGVYDPPDRMKSMLNQALKQEGAEYRFEHDVDFTTKEQQRVMMAGLYGGN